VTYSFFPHTGDIGLRVAASTLDLLFAEAASALTGVLTYSSRVDGRRTTTVELASPDVELLLVDWLNELLFIFETDRLLVAGALVAVTVGAGEARLRAAVTGESFDPDRHPVETLVKAATYHLLAIRQTERGWEATVVLDV
jgi:SHS2 domain-containing protein